MPQPLLDDPGVDRGHHPAGAWSDNTGGALAALLRPRNAGSNAASDHLLVPDRALTQLPDRWREGAMPILVRADGVGYSHTLISAMAAQGLDFSVGYPVTDAVRAAIVAVPERL